MLQQEAPATANMSLLARAHRLQRAYAAERGAGAPTATSMRCACSTSWSSTSPRPRPLAAPLGWPTEADRSARAAVAAHHALAVIVTLGAQGAIARSGHGAWRVAAPPVEVVDTTGAGDAFAGSLAAALDRGDGFVDSRVRPRPQAPRLHRGRRAERPARPCGDRLAGAMGQRIRGDGADTPPGPRCRTHSNRHTAAAAAGVERFGTCQASGW